MEFASVCRYMTYREVAVIFAQVVILCRVGEHNMRSIIAFLLGIVVTIGAAYVHDTTTAGADAKPLVNWDQLGEVTHNAIEAARAQWNKLTK
jgi:hypothetical protein